MRLQEGEGIALYKALLEILKGKPAFSFVQKYGGQGENYALTEDFLRSFLHKSLLEKVKEKSQFFKESSLDQALKTVEKVSELFDNCRRTQLDRKATLACVFAHLEDRNCL
jgi:hypothetical protein